MTNPDVVDTTAEPTVSRSTRRALLGLGVVGAALATSRTVSAAASPDPTAVAQFVIGVELAARDLYRAAPDDMVAEGFPAVLASHHEAYAERVSGILGIPASTRDEGVFTSMESAFADGDLAVALTLENSLAATHALLLGESDNATLLRAIASIVSAESRHAAVIATTSGGDLDAAIINSAAPPAPEA